MFIGRQWGEGWRLCAYRLAALGPCRRQLWGGPGGQLAVGAVLSERGEAEGLWGKMLTGEVLGGYCGSAECLNIGAHLSRLPLSEQHCFCLS